MEGETYSDTATIVLADVPSAPMQPVRKVQSASSSTSLAVEFDELDAGSTNGLVVLSYSLEIDFDLSGNFIPIVGFAND